MQRSVATIRSFSSAGLIKGLTAVALFGFTGAAFAEEPVTVSLALKDHRFTPAEIKVEAGKPFVIKLANEDPTAEEFESSDLKIEKIVAPNSEIVIKVKALKKGRYTFGGEYNQDTAKGIVSVE